MSCWFPTRPSRARTARTGTAPSPRLGKPPPPLQLHRRDSPKSDSPKSDSASIAGRQVNLERLLAAKSGQTGLVKVSTFRSFTNDEPIGGEGVYTTESHAEGFRDNFPDPTFAPAQSGGYGYKQAAAGRSADGRRQITTPGLDVDIMTQDWAAASLPVDSPVCDLRPELRTADSCGVRE